MTNTKINIDEKIKKLLKQSILISPKNREEILEILPKKTKEQKEELLAILESEKKELEAHVKDAMQNDPEGANSTLKRIKTKGTRNLNKKKESIDRGKEDKETDQLLQDLNSI